MASQTRTADDSFKSRALLVFVLTPALIFFMSRKAIDSVQTSPSTHAGATPQLHEQWPAAVPAAIESPFHTRALSAPTGYYGASPSPNLIYARAMFLARNYDSRPYWNHPKLEIGSPVARATADLAIEHLIPCESMGKPINRIDTNGKMSYGILQFQDWDEWERVSGITGDPDNRADAIRMAEWAIENGMINHWTCASILRIM
jgi:hypothetical protein